MLLLLLGLRPPLPHAVVEERLAGVVQLERAAVQPGDLRVATANYSGMGSKGQTASPVQGAGWSAISSPGCTLPITSFTPSD